jgi:RNA-directed DNA polymerase
MKTYNNIYSEIISLKNLILAWRKARKGKTKRDSVVKFEENLPYSLKVLYDELNNQTYNPESMKIFILRDPKTRKISKSAFRDRIVHHALCNVIDPIFDKSFIYENCANRKGKGNLFAIQRLDYFLKKVSKNNSRNCFVLKADIKHYFEEIDTKILLNVIKKKIKCEKTIWLIDKILENGAVGGGGRKSFCDKGMPLGNLTSQFFANVYLNELDQFVKNELKAKYYIRYVDDFVILHTSKRQLGIWKEQIEYFLNEKLKLELHKDKSCIIPISNGIDFVGFRNFYYYNLLRKRNIKNMQRKINSFNKKEMSYDKLFDRFQGWRAYAKWSNNYNLTKRLISQMNP